ncbi:hypothetical protein Kpol_1008p1, partial [Vanderwaltozyma polyspora DSM 70294]
TITVSEADSLTRTITLKGMLNFILGIYKEKQLREDFEINTESDAVIFRTRNCIGDLANDICKAYGKTHPEPKKN